MSRTKSVLKYLLLIMVIYASFYVFLFSLKFFLGSEYPLVVVEGVSMEPTFYDGDLLLVKGVEDKRTIEISQIIVFYQPYNRERLIVHRVVEQIISSTKVEFETKGDNNNVRDQWRVREIDVIGVVVGRVPAIGSVILIIQSPAAKVFTATLLIILIVVNIFYDEEGQGKNSGKSLYKEAIFIFV